MLKKYQGFNFLFIILFVAQLITESDTLTHLLLFQEIRYITKPLITISLIILLAYHTGLRGRFSKRIFIGLFACLIGDVLLMFTDINEYFLMAGLFAFLIGQLAYANAFYLDYSLNKSIYRNRIKNAILAFSFLIIVMGGVLWQHLGNMKIPVILYMLAISTMGVIATGRFGRVNSFSYRAILYGAILFVISDTILAINLFVRPFYAAGFLIMATYMAAQYLITMGNLERKIKKRIEEV